MSLGRQPGIVYLLAVEVGGAPASGERHLPTADQLRMLHAVEVLLVCGVLLVLVVLVGTLLVVRWARRYRQMGEQRPAPPTATEDVWSMHKLPDAADPGDVDPEEEDDE